MKNILIMLLIAFGCTTLLHAQAYEGTVQYNKKKQKAILMEFDFPPEAVENAFIAKMEKIGYKAKEEKGLFNRDKGFIVFNDAFVSDISTTRMDYIIKVERKSRKDKEETMFYLVMNKDDKNMLDKMDVYDVGRAKSYLNYMLPDIEEANLELQIKAQQEIVAKAEKKLGDLKDDEASLEKKLKENKDDQEKTQKDIESQKQALGELIGKRKSFI